MRNPFKNLITKAYVLIGPNWNIPFHIHIDALDYAIGSILGQKERIVEKVIYYINKF